MLDFLYKTTITGKLVVLEVLANSWLLKTICFLISYFFKNFEMVL
ncbi:MAG: hypothetical protein ACOX3T_01215 [Bdellovibrionota bacterium]